MLKKYSILLYIFMVLPLLITFLLACNNHDQLKPNQYNWCDQPLRPALLKLKELKSSRPWFKVYEVDDNVYAIAEPYSFQEIICYLILGKRRTLLFDTGMGMDSLSPLIKELTHLPVTVLNSHTHYDHIGGNFEFKDILAMNTVYTRYNATNGWSHQQVNLEVRPDAFCQKKLPSLDTAKYAVKPFAISSYINDGYKIDLGDIKLKVIAVPGHAPDAIALYDSLHGYLWTGDSFYEGPIYLFGKDTDLKAYHQSIALLAQLAIKCNKIFPGHNTPLVAATELINASKEFEELYNGDRKGELQKDGNILFKSVDFSFLIDSGSLASSQKEHF